MKFTLADSHHNLFHWLTVVLMRIAFFLIAATISVCLTAVGFLLSKKTLQPAFPPTLYKKITLCLDQLPYLDSIRASMFDQLNHWYRSVPTWWTMVVGIPLMLLGASFFLINLFNLYYALVSSEYNRTHCPFCKQPIKAK